MTRFKPGDKVRVQHRFPPGHIRTPWYLRGKTGEVIAHFGAFPNPETRAFGASGLPPVPLYQVLFPMTEVWQSEGAFGPNDTVTADLFEHWLDPVS